MARPIVFDVATTNDTKDNTNPSRTVSVVDAARNFYEQAIAADDKQCKRERDDLRFQIPEPEYQWDDYARQTRSAQVVAGMSVPPRPMLCVDTLTEPIELVLNQMRSAHLGIQIHPLTEDASDDTADILQGLYRHIEVCSRAHLARSWAYDRGVKAGRGVYRILTEYDPESSMPGDQRIVIDRILHQDSVLLDPWARQPDWSDGMAALIIDKMPLERYRREYPDSDVSDFDGAGFLEAQKSYPSWFENDEQTRYVLLAEYYWITLEDEFFDAMNWKTRETIKASRTKRVLHYAKVNGVEEIEPARVIPGQYIPLVPFIGRELQPVDGERRWLGMIAPAKDGARLTNYAASNAVTIAALEPQAPWMMEEGQDEGHQKEWDLSNIIPFPRLRYKRIGLSGLPGNPPQRVQVDVARLGPSMQLLSMGRDFVQTATATYDPALGKQPTAHRSGRALIALQDQSTEATSGYLGNLSEITMPYEAKVILDLIPHIYDRPGRLATILDENLKPSQVYLNAPFAPNALGRPSLLPMEPPDQQAQTMGLVEDPNHPAKYYELSKGRYGVTVTVGKSSQSRLEAGSDALGAILESDPSLMPLIGPEWIKFQDFPGSKVVGDILRKVRENQFPFLKPDDGKQDPNALQQQLAQNQQQIQELTTQLQQAVQFIEARKVESEAKFQTAEMQERYESERAAADRETKLAVAEISASAKQMQDTLKLFLAERARLGVEAHEASQAEKDREHELMAAEQAQAHALEQAQIQAAQQAQETPNASQI